MSARTVDLPRPNLHALADACSLELTGEQVRIRKSGIEFWSATAIPAWTEMTVDVEAPPEVKHVRCTGVVVACLGNRESGYEVSLLFTNLPRHSLARLELISYS